MQVSQSVQIRVEQVNLASKLSATLSRSPVADRPLAAGYYLLRNISFEVCKGDFVAVVGASGAGKTSLLRLLNRLSEPTSGAIYLDDRRLNQIAPVELRRQVILVLQESKLLGMTVQQALEYPLTLQGLTKKAVQQRLETWIERLNIPSDWLSRTELQLSVGQRQLVAIARALVAQPRVLLLDEPTSALDLGHANFILKVLQELTQTGELTVIMANHQLELAKQFCDRVLYLQQGQLLQYISAPEMDWEALQKTLVQAQTQQVEDWGDE